MKKVLIVFGTRPEAIKMCPLVIELKKNVENIKVIVCVTGQHREMLDQVLEAFNVIPDYDLSIMKKNQNLFDVTINILDKTRAVLELEKPNIVLVHGDTSTAFSAALSSFYLKIPIGHVEAGLRTHNLMSPFPEEFNRNAISIIADLNFAPTINAKQNLINENISEKKIFITGNTAIDALKTTVRKNYNHSILEWLGDDKLVLITAHRRENLGEPMKNMFKAINLIVDEYPDLKVVYPIHLNPLIREIADQFLTNERIKLINPLEVLDFHNLMAKSYLILTDSGGIQEEAPSLGVPVLVMRDTTERPEGIEAGTLRLVGTSQASIYANFKQLLDNKEEYNKMSKSSNPYGDGYASSRISQIILNYLGGNNEVS